MGMAAQKRTGRRGRLQSEINVTPFVDVMLVLLVIFMIAAPLLVAGVPVELPETKAEAFNDNNDAITITVNAEGAVFLQDDAVDISAIADKLSAVAGTGYDRRIFVRADAGAAYGDVLDVMGRVNAAGFKNIGLIAEQSADRDG